MKISKYLLKSIIEVVKEGIFQDHVNRELLLEIVRYKSSKVDDVTSLDDLYQKSRG